MGEHFKKPYEISIWEDRLTTATIPDDSGEGTKEIQYYKEIKLAVIGSDKMTSPNRVFDPVFVKKVNGEKSLTFSLAFKYVDPLTGEWVENPFRKFLVNERKIKLYYDDEWYEFVIKTVEEDSETFIFKYTANELFSLELGRVGYAIELDQSLGNCQGTAVELGETILKDTDWIVDRENSDILQQLVQEPIYQCIVNRNINVLNLDTNSEISIGTNTVIYVFYSYIKNKTTNYVQFIKNGDEFIIDDNNVIEATNYRFYHDDGNEIHYNITYETDSEGKITGFNFEGQTIDQIPDVTVEDIFIPNQAYRLVYGQKTLYDNVMERTVDVYKVKTSDGEQDIYHYLDYDYITSDIVTSYISNGTEFSILEDGSVQGWLNTTHTTTTKTDGSGSSYEVLQPIKITSYPEIKIDTKFTDLINFIGLDYYLELKFGGALTSNYKNIYFNSGITDNSSILDHISAGEEFALRTRVAYATKKHGTLNNLSGGGLRAIVAFYKVQDNYSYFLDGTSQYPTQGPIYTIDKNGIILDFNENNFQKLDNYMELGTFANDHQDYVVDSVVQTPSSQYIYKSSNEPNVEYIYSTENKINKYVPVPSNYIHYYITTAKALRSVSNEKLSDPTTKIGLFLYSKDSRLTNGTNYTYVRDIQLTRCYRDANNQIVTIGNIPTGLSILKDHFYLKPEEGMTAEQVNTYNDLKYLAEEKGYSEQNIIQVRNEDCEKVLSVTGSQSNCFNLLQSICETFECWLDIKVEHESNGAIKLNRDYNPIKKIAFKKYAGKPNFAGFKYGINLNSIQRSVDSESFVTKMIVDPVQSDYSTYGTMSIADATSNPSNENYILNFNYYLNQGLITNQKQCNEDIQNLYDDIQQYNKDYLEKQKTYNEKSLALVNIKGKINAEETLITEARESLVSNLALFREMTGGREFKEYISKVSSIKEWIESLPESDKDKIDIEDLLENDNLLSVVSEIYVAQATIDNYSGILANLKKEYYSLNLDCNGAKDYNISVSVIEPAAGTNEYTTKLIVDDFLEDAAFSLGTATSISVTHSISINERIFTETSTIPYTHIYFNKIPDKYQLVYYENNQEHIIDTTQNKSIKSFEIYEAGNGGVTRRFKFIPEENYKAQHKGLIEESKELLEQKRLREKEFYKKYSRFIQEGTWSSTDYIDPELYYFDALQVSNTSAQPQVSYTINVAEVSEIEGLENYNFDVGDKSYIEDTHFFGYHIDEVYLHLDLEDKPFEVKTPVQEEIIVSEVEWHLDAPEENIITIQNYKTQFEDLFQRVSAAVQTLEYNEATYAKTSAILDSNGDIKGDLLAKSIEKAGIFGYYLTSDGTIQIIDDGLLIENLTNHQERVKIISSGIQFSKDGGETWQTALSADGITTDALTSGSINTQLIRITDGDNPSFTWDKYGLNAYGFDEDGDGYYDLKTYVRFDKYGLYGVKNGENFVANNLDEIKDTAHFGITWDGFFIKNSYTNGYVSITSDNDFQVINTVETQVDHYEPTTDETVNPEKIYYILDDDEYSIVGDPIDENIDSYYEYIDSEVEETEIEKIKIGALEFDGSGSPTKYGININNDIGESVFTTDDRGDVVMSGTIYARAGEIGGMSVDNTRLRMDHIVFKPGEGIYSDWGNTSTRPFEISDKDGSATFNNVTVRGSIKTSVFEYEEIQAVGGAFMFRPSTTIKTVEEDDGDLVITVEKPMILRDAAWYKLSNYNSDDAIDAEELTTYGLTHIYQLSVTKTEDNTEIRLLGGAAILQTLSVDDICGGSVIDMGFEPNTYRPITLIEGVNPHDLKVYELVNDEYVITEDTTVDSEKTYYKEWYQEGINNYGIGINSSDNYINLPPRAISLFETIVDHTQDPKVSYNFRGILGTLPDERVNNIAVNSSIYPYMRGTQGIYTDNMYIGDDNQFLTFYTDGNGNKRLRIRANQLEFEAADSTPENPQYHDVTQIEAEGVPGPPGQDAIRVEIDSNLGDKIFSTDSNILLTCHVFRGASEVLPNLITEYKWRKFDKYGNEIINSTWPKIAGQTIQITAEDVFIRAIFGCDVTF